MNEVFKFEMKEIELSEDEFYLISDDWMGGNKMKLLVRL